jgi:hypothetical protein
MKENRFHGTASYTMKRKSRFKREAAARVQTKTRPAILSINADSFSEPVP